MHKDLQRSIEKREGLTGNPLIWVGTEGVGTEGVNEGTPRMSNSQIEPFQDGRSTQ